MMGLSVQQRLEIIRALKEQDPSNAVNFEAIEESLLNSDNNPIEDKFDGSVPSSQKIPQANNGKAPSVLDQFAFAGGADEPDPAVSSDAKEDKASKGIDELNKLIDETSGLDDATKTLLKKGIKAEMDQLGSELEQFKKDNPEFAKLADSPINPNIEEEVANSPNGDAIRNATDRFEQISNQFKEGKPTAQILQEMKDQFSQMPDMNMARQVYDLYKFKRQDTLWNIVFDFKLSNLRDRLKGDLNAFVKSISLAKSAQ